VRATNEFQTLKSGNRSQRGDVGSVLFSYTFGLYLAWETVEILEWVARRGRRAEGKKRARRIPAAGCNERATTPSACLPRALRVASLLALVGVARWAEIAADIDTALAS
jgi:hypothetical protein